MKYCYFLQNLEKKDVIIHELELEKTKIEDKKKSVDLECVGLSETNKELQNQVMTSSEYHVIILTWSSTN